LSLCSRCGASVSRSAEQVYRRGQGRYPLLCDSCMLQEMDRRASERATCESCGRRIERLRRNAITRMERQGLSPVRLCLTCLKKQLDSSTSDTYSGPSYAADTLPQMDDWGETIPVSSSSSEHRVLCPWCLSTLPHEDLVKLKRGHRVTCAECGSTLTSDNQ